MERCESLIKHYFSLGLQQQEIIAFLKILHNISLSERTLKRILKNLKLYRRKNYSKIEDVVSFLQGQLSRSSQLHGYRWMHLKCLQNGLTVTQDIVRELLQILDPQGVAIRKRKRLRRRQYHNKGPNYVWHMDAYDKLKPYGICISGCIDGFSRHIIWLRAGTTSNNPKVIGGYYLNIVKQLGGCPTTVRSDMGTENGVVERIQKALRELFPSVESERPSFLYGKSTANQRIESWWSILRKHNAQFWMNLFETLKDDGLFDGSFLDKSLIQFCFMEIIQVELDTVAMEWNLHKIRSSRNSRSPTGRPAIMFEMPALYSTTNFLHEIPSVVLNVLHEYCTFNEYSCDKDVHDICQEIMEEEGFSKNMEPYDAVQLYVNLRHRIKHLLANH